MPLLDHFRLPRFARSAAPPPAPSVETAPTSRLDRVLARQKTVRIPSDLERRLEALEEECSKPLYGSGAYSTPLSDPRGD